MLLILCGPTAAGKDTYQQMLLDADKDLNRAISYTTRPMRNGEKIGREYYFINSESFYHLSVSNFFIEERKYNTIENGQWTTWRYGLPKSQVSKDKKLITILDHQGTLEVLRQAGDVPVKVVYLYADNEILKKRSLNRGDEQEEFDRRLADDIIKFQGIEKIADLMLDTTSNHMENIEKIQALLKDGGEKDEG